MGKGKEQLIDRQLPVGTRVTVRLPPASAKSSRAAVAVSPREPREVAGLYWGYSVRLAPTLSAVWSACPYEGGYDFTIGTSEHGTSVEGSAVPSFQPAPAPAPEPEPEPEPEP